MKLLRTKPKPAPVSATARLVATADAANAARHWPEAAAAYAAALAIDPAHPALWVQYGHSLKEQGFLREAEAAYLRAVAGRPDEADTHLQLGHVLKLQNDHERAVAAYEAAHRLAPTMTAGRTELAELRAHGVTTVPTDGHLHPRDPSGDAQPPGDPDFLADVRAAGLAAGPDAASRAALLRHHGLSDAVLDRFDSYFYYHANPAARMELPSANRNACLVHFCRKGIDALLPISVRDAFDAAFYRTTYLDGMPFTPANAYRHWLRTGLDRAMAPNRWRWLAAEVQADVTPFDDSLLLRFAGQVIEAPTELSWPALVSHFLAHAGQVGRTFDADPGHAAFITAVADRLDRDGGAASQQAFRLREQLSYRFPALTANQVKHAAGLRDRGAVAAGAAALSKLAEFGVPSAMVFLRLAEMQEQMGFIADAVQTVQRARAAHPGDQFFRGYQADLARRFMWRAWDGAVAAARARQPEVGQHSLAAACLLASPPGTVRDRAPGRAIRRVAIVGNTPLPQCKFYRIDQKVEQLEASGYDVAVFDLSHQAAAFLDAAHLFEAAIFFRVPALPECVAAIDKATQLGLVTFYDMDDLIFETDYPGDIAGYGGRITQADYDGQVLAVPLFQRAMALCRYGIASTPGLVTAMQRRVASGTVFEHPNALGRVHTRFMRTASRRPGGPSQVTLFYGSGTKAHKEDFDTLLLPALVEMVRRHGDRVMVTLIGDFPDSKGLQSIAKNLVIYPPIWDQEAYWSVLASADINLAVLHPSATTNAKSAIKWLEAAMLGIPSVVSDTDVYLRTVRDGETGVICRTPQEWTGALDRLIRNPALRQSIGDAARAQALAEFGEQTMADRMDAMLRAVSAPVDTRPLIVVVNVFYPPQAVGGATRVVHDNIQHCRAIPDCAFRFEVFTSINGGEPYRVSTEAADGVRVTGVGTPTVTDLEHRADDPRMGEIFGAFLDRTRPALVHFHCVQRLSAAVVFAAEQRGIPFLVSLHDGWWISPEQFLLDGDGQVVTYDYARPMATLSDLGPAAYQRMARLRMALSAAQALLAVSESFARIYRACGFTQVRTIANGVSDLAVMPRHPTPDGRVRLGFIGGLARHKGYDLLVLALRAQPYRNLALLLVDHALDAGDVRHEQWGTVPVEIRPKTPQENVGALYAQIDVLVAPSIWPESFGLVTREAALCGCWVIASDRGGIGEDVSPGENGFVVDVATVQGLVTVLEQIDASPEHYRAPPALRQTPRLARTQADELYTLYHELLPTTGANAAGLDILAPAA